MGAMKRTHRVCPLVFSVITCVLLLIGAELAKAQASATTTASLPASIAPPPVPGKWGDFWIARVKEFIAENAGLDPKQRNIVFLGDSLTQGFKLKSYFPDQPVLNRGIVSDGGCDFPFGRSIYRGVTHRMDESIYNCRPSHLFYLIGTNDVGVTNIPLDYWLGAYKYVIAQTRAKFPDVKIILVTCPPTGEAYARRETLNARILEWNDRIRKYAVEEKFRLIDLHALLVGTDGLLPKEMTRDGLHFNQIGYDRWAEAARAILKEDGVIKEDAAKQ
jgi:lysophospholipase L1-like esterase